jgi:hypothetical protein
MKGREQAQQKQFAQANQMIKGLQYSHNNDGQKLASLAQQGYSPQNDAEKAVLIPEQARNDQQRQTIQQIPPDRLKQLNEYAAAKSAVDVSFGRMMKMYANATGLGQQKGKGKSKDKSQSDDQGQPNIGAMIASKNPQEKAQGTVLLTAKAGSPWVYYADQIAAQRQAQANDSARQHAQVMAELQQKFDTLSAIPSDKRTPEQGAELAQVQEQMHQQKEFTNKLPTDKGPQIVSYGTDAQGNSIPLTWDADGKKLIPVPLPEGVKGAGKTSKAPAALSKPGTIGSFYDAVSRESNIPVAEFSADTQLGLNRAFAASHKTATVSDTFYTYKDDVTGQVVQVPLQRKTPAPAMSVPTPQRSGESASATAAPSSQHHAAFSTAKHAAAGATATAPSAATELPPGSPPGTRVVGQVASAADKMIMHDAIKAADRARTLTSLLDAQEEYIKKVSLNPRAATPRQDLSLIVAAVRAMNPGSVRLPQKELEMEIRAGSWGDRFRRQAEVAATGLLPDDQRNDLFGIVRNETTAFGKVTAANWQQAFAGKKEVPAHLKRFVEGNAGAGGGTKKPLDKATALKFYEQAGHDPKKATQLAIDAGYNPETQ